MKKILGAIAALAMMVGLAACGTPANQGTTNPNQLVVGMEAGYPPFNWTQNDDSNGGVKIQGTNQYAGGYDVEIAKLVAQKLRKELADLIFDGIELKDISYYEEKYPKRELKQGAYVTRFAPSPTGFMHTGGVYTALVSKMMAKRTGGIFYLRIEDTDTERGIENGIEEIVETMQNYNLIPDEGVRINNGKIEEFGKYGPYIQSKRKEIYMAYAKHLIEEGKAYPCFYTKEELEEVREKQRASKLRTGMYGLWSKYRDMPAELAIEKIKEGIPYVLRFKSEGDYNKKIIITDLVKGKLELPQDDQDIVIIKKDGLPTYHFAHVIDDHLMGTNLVIRTDEWFPSVALHVGLFLTLGFDVPKYAHPAPLQKLDNGNRRKLSKRKDPEAKASYYLKEGVPVDAIEEYFLNVMNSNFEMWRKQNPDKDITEFDFKIGKMGVAGALFDSVKLLDVSKNYISRLTTEKLYEEVLNWSKKYDQKTYDIITKQKERTLEVFGIERGNVKKPRKDISKYNEIYDLNIYMYNDLFEKMDRKYQTFENLSDEEETRIIAIVERYLEIYDENAEKEQWFNTIKELAGEFRIC